MQFDVSLTAGAARTAQRRAGDVALPDLLSLLRTIDSPPARRDGVKRAALEDSARQRTLRRDDLAHGASQSERALEQIKCDERRLRPGSAAARQAQRQEQAEPKRARDGQTSFRSTLTDARTLRAGGEQKTDPAPPPSTESKSSSPARPAAGTAEPARPESRAAGTAPLRSAAGTNVPWASRPTAAHGTHSAAGAPQAVTGLRSVNAASRTALQTPTGSGAGDVAARPATPGGPPAPTIATAGPAREGTATTARDAARAQPSPPDTSPRTNDANVERILRSIRTHADGDRATATLRLDPPELGSVRLLMDLRAAQLTLVVETQTSEARRLLESQLDSLRDGLEAAGIRLERAEVRLVTPPEPGLDTGSAAQSNANDTGRQDGSAPSPDGSAGGGVPTGTDATPDSDAPEALPVDLEPAAESRVNVWA